MVDRIRPAALSKKPLIRMLQQPYLHELSEYGHILPNKYGEYENRYLDSYWTEEGRYPYLILHGRKVAGFALVRIVRDTYHMAEFFILRPYRKQGLGRWAATEILTRHRGKWHIEFYNTNTPARDFWKKVATANARGQIREHQAGSTRTWLGFEKGRV